MLPARSCRQRDLASAVNDLRNELQGLLRAAGTTPAPDLPALQRAVRARIAAERMTRTLVWWRSWTTAGLVAAGLACGLLSAAWRAERSADNSTDAHARYLQLIDPLVRASGAVQS